MANSAFTPTNVQIGTTPTSVVTGRTDGVAPSAGYIGEIMTGSTLVGSATALTNGQFKDIGNVVLTAGIWDLSMTGAITGSPTGLTAMQVGIGTVTGNSTTGMTDGQNRIGFPITSISAVDGAMGLPPQRVSISATTTYYGKVNAIFSGGTCSGYGLIRATRVA